jgi:hypothetical protein
MRALRIWLMAGSVVAIVAGGAFGLGTRKVAHAAEHCPIELTKGGVCTLHGKVKIVNAFPKYKIKIVNAFPDIKVQKVNAFPDGPGKWQFVDAFPDFTVQIVDAFPDFTVQYVNAFPGCD